MKNINLPMNRLESHVQTNFYVYYRNYTNYLQRLATYLPLKENGNYYYQIQLDP